MRGSPVRKTSSGILRLVAKLLPGSVVAPRAPRHLELELAGRRRQHDEAALGAAHLDGRIQHEREHVVQYAAGAEGAQPLEQDGNLPQVADRGRRGRARPGGGESARRNTISAPPVRPEPDPIAVRERAFGDLLTVDIRAVARVPVAEDEMVVLERDFGVVARHLAPGKPQIVRLAPPDLELPFGDRHDAPAEGVGHFESGVGHGESLMEDPRIAKTAQRRRTPDEQDGQRPAGADSSGELVDFGVGRGS